MVFDWHITFVLDVKSGVLYRDADFYYSYQDIVPELQIFILEAYLHDCLNIFQLISQYHCGGNEHCHKQLC